MILPLLLVFTFWAAAYYVAGWPALFFMALLGALGELALLWVGWREGRGAR